MKIKRVFFSLLVIMVFITVSATPIFAGGTDKEIYVSLSIPAVKAKSVVVMDANTGHILFENSEHEKVPVSYLVKMMTLLLTARAIDIGKLTENRMLVTSKHANATKDPQLWLNVGETISVSDALIAVCMANPNDAAMVLAEAVGGNEDRFVAMMNETAKELGMSDTCFKNATGIDCDDQYSSAHDMALLGKELLKHEYLIPHMTNWMVDLRNGKTNVVNTNKLVRTYKGITGLKAASSSSAGSCIALSANRSKMHLICIVLGSPDFETMFSDAKAVLDYSFSVNTYFEPEINEESLNKIKIKGGQELDVAVKSENRTGIIIPTGTSKEVTTQIILPESIDAPVSNGQCVGEIIFLNGEDEIFRTRIITCKEVKKKTTLFCFKKILNNLLKF